MRALVLTLVACAATPRGPTAIVRFTFPEEWTSGDRIHIEDGLDAWRELGFETFVEVESELPRCRNDWMRTQQVDCQLTIGLRKELGMSAAFGKRAMADRVIDMILVDSDVSGVDLAHVIAHEVGHIILNTAKHTTHGVMVSGGWLWDLSAKDRALACETIGRGCK